MPPSRHRRRPLILVHSKTFEQLFGFLWFIRHDYWPWPIDYVIRFWSIFVVTLTLNFQGQIWSLLYLSQKLSNCHWTKTKYSDWNLGFKCDHRVWPWPWHWPWIFKVKYEICYTSAKMIRLPRNEKQIYRLNPRTQMWQSDFTLTMTLTFEFSRSNVTLTFDHTHGLDHG